MVFIQIKGKIQYLTTNKIIYSNKRPLFISFCFVFLFVQARMHCCFARKMADIKASRDGWLVGLDCWTKSDGCDVTEWPFIDPLISSISHK